MAKSNIAWTDETWNVTSGCTKCSPGCINCYAERMAKRLQVIHPHKYADGFAVTLHHEELEKPYRWRKPRTVFVSSMGDLFHEDVPDEYIRDVFRVMTDNPKHTFQVLTKRAERMARFAETISWPRNVWAGVTVESNAVADRADHLRTIHAPVRFVSAEPLLGPLTDLSLEGVDWLIAGGESGPGWRPIEADWVRDLRDRCTASGIRFFFKQWSALHPKQLGDELDGRAWHEIPDDTFPRRKLVGVKRHPVLTIDIDDGMEL